ncbi:hypothetical protein QFC20_002290 [Naganishia adeliensis]|uniref:Uncharacterized protein n=1 Tax=Naganishia adeliensis TaxID=92952 RepID=A0ACC2WLR3_9TREE|nr:hypothetical protein QFC20_002290 [Naganishia adeliensis]
MSLSALLKPTGFRVASKRLAVPTSRFSQARFLETSAAASEPAQQLPESSSEPFTVKLHAESFHGYRCDPPSLDVSVTKDQMVDLYTQMEAVSVGMESAITHEDNVITAYRCHPFAVLRGGTIHSVLAELLGKETGIAKGKGGSMHMFTKCFYGGNGIVGAQVPVGAGIAFAQKYNDKKSVTFSMYGDGASNQGQVFEAYNMASRAKLWNLPVVFTCENNKYGMGTSAERSSQNTMFFTRGDQIPGIQVNGMDVLAVHKACQWAKEWTTSGKGPLLIEFVTYRYGGHSMSDPGTTYRTREEIQQMRSTRDAITGIKTYLSEWGIADDAKLKAIDKAAKAEVDEAVAQAKKDAFPDLKAFWTDIYYDGTEPPFTRGRVKDEMHVASGSA